jgi:hypothetical protein
MCIRVHTQFTNKMRGYNVVFLDAFAKLPKATISFVMLVCLSDCPSIRMEVLSCRSTGLSWNLTFEYFSIICWENSSFIKIRQEYRELYLKEIHIYDHTSLIWRLWDRALWYISIVKPTRCTIFSSLLSINVHVSDDLSVHHQEFKTVHTPSVVCHTGLLTAY